MDMKWEQRVSIVLSEAALIFLFYQPGQWNCCRQEGGDSTYDYCCPESYCFVQLKVALVFQCYTTILSFNPVTIILAQYITISLLQHSLMHYSISGSWTLHISLIYMLCSWHLCSMPMGVTTFGSIPDQALPVAYNIHTAACGTTAIHHNLMVQWSLSLIYLLQKYVTCTCRNFNHFWLVWVRA